MNSKPASADFPAWMSPMLVKELRQGLRSRIFAAAFMITQVLMILAVIFGFLISRADASGNLNPMISSIFWTMICVPLLLIMPFRAFGALNEEIRGDTLELIFLTRQTSWRILAGKWAALVFQSLLIVAAVLPYVVLRYFLGAIDLVAELQALLFVLLFSLVMTAGLISLSPIQSPVLRWLIILITLGGLLFLPGVVLAMASFSAISGAPAPGASYLSWKLYLAIVAFAPLMILAALEMGAARIAPVAENHALPKRLLTLALFAVAVVLALIGVPAEIVMLFALVGALPTAAEGLCEPPQYARIIYRNLWSKGPPGKLLGSLFWPGWQYAIFFVLLLAVIGGIAGFATGILTELDDLAGYLAIIAIILLPAAVGRLIRPNSAAFLGWYVGLQVGQFIVTFLVMAMVAGDAPLLPSETVMIFPSGTMLLWVFDNLDAYDAKRALMIQVFWIVGSIFAIITAAGPVYREIAQLNQTPDASHGR